MSDRVTMILLIDNYDSFVFNLARYFERLGQTTRVVRNDAIDARGVEALAPAAVVLSPGPCTPDEAGCSLDVVRHLAGTAADPGDLPGTSGDRRGARRPHRARRRTGARPHVARFFTTATACSPACPIRSSVAVTIRWWSSARRCPTSWKSSAWTADGTIMALGHRTQLSGRAAVSSRIDSDRRRLRLAGRFLAAGRRFRRSTYRDIDGERAEPPVIAAPLPGVPVTF